METNILNIALYVAIIAPSVAVLAIVIRGIVKPYRRENDDWSKIAGYFEGTGTLQHEGINVNVSHRLLRGSIYGGIEGLEILHFTVEAPLRISKKSALLLYKKSFLNSSFVKRFGAKTVKSSNPAFNEKFIIESSDEQYVQSLFTEEIQDKLLTLSKIFEPRLYADNGVVSFSVVKKKPQNKEQYNMIVSTVLMIFSQIKKLNPMQSVDVSVKQIDRKNLPKIFFDLIKDGFKTTIIIFFGLVLFCILVMKILG